MNLPNKLTLFRIFLVPIIIFLYLFPFYQFGINLPIFYINGLALPLINIIVVVLFIIASVTDYIDGYLARKYDLITTFGKFMDPIADKLLVNSLIILLSTSGSIPPIVAIVMICRDIMVDGIRMLASQSNTVLAASYLGKAKTATQMVAIVMVLLNNMPFEFMNIPASSLLIYLATAISFVSGVDYFMKNKSVIFESK